LVEALSDNYLGGGGYRSINLDPDPPDHPITCIGLGFRLVQQIPLNWDYLHRLKALATRIEPVYVSDHLAWVSERAATISNDLAPLPYNEPV